MHRVLKDGGGLVLQEPGRCHGAQAYSIAQMESPMHIVVAAKRTPCADSRRPETLLARFRASTARRPCVSGVPATFRVRVQNTGQTRWIAVADPFGGGHGRLGLSLLDAEGRLRQLEFGRCSLARDVVPGREDFPRQAAM